MVASALTIVPQPGQATSSSPASAASSSASSSSASASSSASSAASSSGFSSSAGSSTGASASSTLEGTVSDISAPLTSIEPLFILSMSSSCFASMLFSASIRSCFFLLSSFSNSTIFFSLSSSPSLEPIIVSRALLSSSSCFARADSLSVSSSRLLVMLCSSLLIRSSFSDKVFSLSEKVFSFAAISPSLAFRESSLLVMSSSLFAKSPSFSANASSLSLNEALVSSIFFSLSSSSLCCSLSFTSSSLNFALIFCIMSHIDSLSSMAATSKFQDLYYR